MKMHEFSGLPTGHQLQLLYECGNYLGKINSGDDSRLLYQFDAFYVEIQYFKYRQTVKQINCFESTDFLEPYLKNISIEELINC